MKYFVEPIGAQFTNQDIKALAEKFTNRSTEGWKLHSVFSVTQAGCLGPRGSTHLAIYVKD